MNAGALFLSLDGRIGRLQWWIGAIVVEAVALLLKWLLGVPIAGDPSTFQLRLTAFAIDLLAAYPALALAVKRLHDRGRSGIVVLPLVAAFAVILLGDLFGQFDEAAPTTLPKLLFMIVLAAVVLGYLVEFGFRRGDAGPNDYGPDPGTKPASGTPPA